MTGDAAGGGRAVQGQGPWSVIIDRKTPAADRAAMLIDALAGFDTDALFLPPKVREAIAARRSEPAANLSSEAQTREAQPGEAQPGEAQPGEAQPGEAQPG